jgi:hypothetical protein
MMHSAAEAEAKQKAAKEEASKRAAAEAAAKQKADEEEASKRAAAEAAASCNPHHQHCSLFALIVAIITFFYCNIGCTQQLKQKLSKRLLRKRRKRLQLKNRRKSLLLRKL